MTTAVTRTRTLSDQIAEEIRALMARRRMTGRELARRLGKSHSWVNYRLTGQQEIGVNDLQRIAAALGVGVAALLPESASEVQAVTDTVAYRSRPEKVRNANRSPADTRPAGHPRTGGARRPQLIGDLMDRVIGLVSPPVSPAVA